MQYAGTANPHIAPVSRKLAPARCGWAQGWTETNSRSYWLREDQVQAYMDKWYPLIVILTYSEISICGWEEGNFGIFFKTADDLRAICSTQTKLDFLFGQFPAFKQ